MKEDYGIGKVYGEVPAYVWTDLRRLERRGRIEQHGVLRSHERYHGEFWDVAIVSTSASDFDRASLPKESGLLGLAAFAKLVEEELALKTPGLAGDTILIDEIDSLGMFELLLLVEELTDSMLEDGALAHVETVDDVYHIYVAAHVAGSV